MKIYKGIIKKVPSERNFEEYNKGDKQLSNLKLIETIVDMNINGEKKEVLPIRLSYIELDSNGNEFYKYDVDKDIYLKVYSQTPILYAFDKELRILLEYGEYTPVKIVVSEIENDGYIINKIECIQNQHSGLM